MRVRASVCAPARVCVPVCVCRCVQTLVRGWWIWTVAQLSKSNPDVDYPTLCHDHYLCFSFGGGGHRKSNRIFVVQNLRGVSQKIRSVIPKAFRPMHPRFLIHPRKHCKSGSSMTPWAALIWLCFTPRPHPPSCESLHFPARLPAPDLPCAADGAPARRLRMRRVQQPRPSGAASGAEDGGGGATFPPMRTVRSGAQGGRPLAPLPHRIGQRRARDGPAALSDADVVLSPPRKAFPSTQENKGAQGVRAEGGGVQGPPQWGVWLAESGCFH